MSTSAKTCQPKNIKKAKYKMASPISNDRAKAFVGPQAEVSPRFSEVPSEQDAKAFRLAAKGMTQREIAKKLHTSQPTVQRGIKKYRLWFGSTLPEDRGELVGWQRFRVAVEERRIFLRHQQELAMEEWQQSRQSVPMKRTRTKVDPEGRQVDGMPIKEIQIDEWVHQRRGSASHLNAAAKRSLELTMLEGGYLGVHKLSCDLAIDTDERDRWDRAVKSYKATIEELSRKVAELEAKLASKNSTPHAPREEVFMRSVKSTLDESRTEQTTPSVNQCSSDSELASPVQKATSGERPDSCPLDFQSVNQVNQEPRIPCSQVESVNERTGINRSATSGGPPSLAAKVKEEGESGTLKTPDPGPPPAPQYRWEDSFRQEALDYHCLKFGLPPATTDMATGIPDPFKMSPRLWIERGYPYQIYIDREIPCTRRNPLDTMGVIKLACPAVVNPEGW